MNGLSSTFQLIICILAIASLPVRGMGAEQPNSSKPVADQGERPLQAASNQRVGRASKASNSLNAASGKRTITVTNRDDTIVIKEEAGQQISVKHTRSIAGQIDTVEVNAVDQKELKQKSPAVAALYAKYALAPMNPDPAQIRLQFPLPVRDPTGDSDHQVLEDELDPHRNGPRTIRVDLADRRIEIQDGNTRQIRLKISKIQDGLEQVDEFVADGPVRFREAYPEHYKTYEKYTGVRREDK